MPGLLVDTFGKDCCCPVDCWYLTPPCGGGCPSPPGGADQPAVPCSFVDAYPPDPLWSFEFEGFCYYLDSSMISSGEIVPPYIEHTPSVLYADCPECCDVTPVPCPDCTTCPALIAIFDNLQVRETGTGNTCSLGDMIDLPRLTACQWFQSFTWASSPCTIGTQGNGIFCEHIRVTCSDVIGFAQWTVEVVFLGSGVGGSASVVFWVPDGWPVDICGEGEYDYLGDTFGAWTGYELVSADRATIIS